MARGPRGLVGRRKKQLETQAAVFAALRGAKKAHGAVDSYIQNMSLYDAVLWGSGSVGPKTLLQGAKMGAGKAKKVFNLLRRKKPKPKAKPARSPFSYNPEVKPVAKPAKPKKTTLSGRPGAIKKNGKHSGGLERYVDLSQWGGQRGNWRGRN